MDSSDVVGFGALNIDRLYRVNRIAREDEESVVTGFSESCGGSAANTIIGLAKLRLKTGYIGKLAEDRDGRLHLEEFKREGVDTRGIIIARNGRSGAVTGFVDKDGERALYIDPGVNDAIKFDEIDLKYAKKAKFLHLTSFVGEKSFEAQKMLMAELPDNVKVSFDPGILYARKGLNSLKPLIEKAFVMLPSERELELLTNEGYENGAKILIEKGVNIVAAKLGERGCYVADRRGGRLVDPYHVKVVDTTGAGDAFSSGFLYGLVQEKGLYECGKMGNYVASRCIQETGAREGLPTRSDLENNFR
ncbi:hypothetical protein AKJ58_00670 [candidate division MSBL1 archaeon SCGC-AAA385D11]|uniref:Carbohydrate kinase PfkB domain-containing protein n=1 Tax=candidate division MSBL1 archaeon SCGC-AAA385D11 TaxID=1698286 RepID=A0A133VP14_9EURY|nr:hypothetical protein AKJ58_00670 [candidate division MSBL1 archaeon SCGC-AAA385D11]